eukprot:1545483-Ditylum_brightwellii.AAC.1
MPAPEGGEYSTLSQHMPTPEGEENTNNEIPPLVHHDEAGIAELDPMEACHRAFISAKANALDTPNYYQAVNRPDTELFVKAMEEKMATLYDLQAWEIIDQADVPYTAEGARCMVIESTWAFKVKIFPDGLVKKYKAQLCVRGGQQVK